MPIQINFNDLRSLPFSKRDKLPAEPAVYFVIKNNKILYIGKAYNLKARWNSHHRSSELEKLRGLKIAWLEITNKALLTEIEKALIKHFKPELNIKKYYKDYTQKPVKRNRIKKITKKIK